MARSVLPPRLYFDENRGRWVIRFKSVFRRTSFNFEQKEQAQQALNAMLEGRSTLAVKLRRRNVKRIEDLAERDYKRGNGKIYFISAGEAIKIGWCKYSAKNRLVYLQTGNHIVLEIVAECDGSFETEQELHKTLVASRINNEWYGKTPEVMNALEFAKTNDIQSWI